MKKFIAIFFTFLSTTLNAADINCRGSISWIMADHPRCDGNIAFKTDSTGGRGGKWLCTKSKEGSAIAMMAFASDKTVEVYVEGSDVAACRELPHYREISYIIVNP